MCVRARSLLGCLVSRPIRALSLSLSLSLTLSLLSLSMDRGALKGVRTGHKAHHPVPGNAWAAAEKRDSHAPGGWFPHPAPRVEFAAEHWDLIC